MRRFPVIIVFACAFAASAVSRGQSTVEPQEFFYNAVWDIAQNDFDHSTIQRIQLTATRYDEVKNSFVTSFLQSIQTAAPGQPGYAPQPAAPAGATQLAEIRLSLDTKVTAAEAPIVLSFDTGLMKQAIQSGSDPRSLAEWTFYFWQMRLWEYYVAHETLLVDEDLTLQQVDDMIKTIYNKREPVWKWTGINPKDRLPQEWVQDKRQFRALPQPKPGETAAIDQMRSFAESGAKGVIRVLQAPDTAKDMAAGAYRMFSELAYSREADEHDRYFGMINRLRERQESRKRHDDMLAFQRDLVVDFAKDWALKYDGTEFGINGVLYLVSTEPLKSVPRNAQNVVIDSKDSVVTPYNILQKDGSLKNPAPIED